MMEPEITCDWIDRYNDDDLDETEKVFFEKRMLVNPLLRSEVQIDASLNRFLMDEELLDLMHKIRIVSQRNEQSSKMMNSFLIAASVFCLAMIGGIFYLLHTNKVTSRLSLLQHTEQIHQKKRDEPDKWNVSLPLKKATPRGLLAKNFETLAEFELLVGSVTRSHQFKLISPHMNLTVPAGTEVLFTWRHCGGKIPVSIIILNNQGIMMSENQPDHANSYILKTKGFGVGLFYWKIMADDDLVLMGKLTIL